MPINPYKLDELEYHTWTVAGAAARQSGVQKKIASAITTAIGNFARVSSGSVNMWHLQQPVVEVTSSKDGTVAISVHVNQVGANLFIGRAIKTTGIDNYYKLFHAIAIAETVDLAIAAAIGDPGR